MCVFTIPFLLYTTVQQTIDTIFYNLFPTMSANSESEKFGFEISTPCPNTNTEWFELFKAGTPISFISGSETIWVINPLSNPKLRFACGLCLTENANLVAFGQHTKRCSEFQLKKHNPDYVNKFVTEKLTTPCKSTGIPNDIKVEANKRGGIDGFNYLNEYLESKLTPQEKIERTTRIALEEEKRNSSALRKELEQMKKKIADNNKDKGASSSVPSDVTTNDSNVVTDDVTTYGSVFSDNAPPFVAKARKQVLAKATQKVSKKKRKEETKIPRKKKTKVKKGDASGTTFIKTSTRSTRSNPTNH